MTLAADHPVLEYKDAGLTGLMSAVLNPGAGPGGGNQWVILGGPGGAERKSAFDLASDPDGTAWCIVAVTGVKDDVDDIIVPGAFGRTLKERQIKGVLGHDWNRPVARAVETIELLPGDPRLPATLSDGTTPWPSAAGALLVKAAYLLGTADGRDAWEHAKAFDKDHAYSIGYKVTDGGATHKGGIRYIRDLDLYEFSPVLHGANRLATLQAVKSNGHAGTLETGDLTGAEVKVAYVRDAEYWGRPIGTLIVPGMKPRGPKARGARRVGQRTPATVGTAPTPAAAQRGVAGGMGSVGVGGLRRDTASNLAARGTATPASRTPAGGTGDVTPARAREVAKALNVAGSTVQDAQRYNAAELNAAAAVLEGSARAKDRRRGKALRQFADVSARAAASRSGTASLPVGGDDIPTGDRAIPVRRRISTDPKADAAEIAAEIEENEPALFAEPERTGVVRASRRATGDVDFALDAADQAGVLNDGEESDERDRLLSRMLREGIDPDELDDTLAEREIPEDVRDAITDAYAIRYGDARAAQGDANAAAEDPELDAALAEVAEYWEGDGEDLPDSVDRLLDHANAAADRGDIPGAAALAEMALESETGDIDPTADPRFAEARASVAAFAAERTGIADRGVRKAYAFAATGSGEGVKLGVETALSRAATGSGMRDAPAFVAMTPAERTAWARDALGRRNAANARKWGGAFSQDADGEAAAGELEMWRDEQLLGSETPDALALSAAINLLDGVGEDRAVREIDARAAEIGLARADVAEVIEALAVEARARRRGNDAYPLDGDALLTVGKRLRAGRIEPEGSRDRDTGGTVDTGGGDSGQDRGTGTAALGGASAGGSGEDDRSGRVLPGAGDGGGAADRDAGRRAGRAGADDSGGGGDVRGPGGPAADGARERGVDGAAGAGADRPDDEPGGAGAGAGAGRAGGAGDGDGSGAGRGAGRVRGGSARAGRDAARAGSGDGEGAGAGDSDRVAPAGDAGAGITPEMAARLEAGRRIDIAARPNDAGEQAPGVVGEDQPLPNVELVNNIPEGGERFRPGGVDDLAPAGEKGKLDANMAALRVLRRLQREAPARPATPEEQAILARWAGWGGLPKVFDTRETPWPAETEELLELLSTSEWNEARRNTLNAHYTDARVTQAVWKAVQDLGFDGGRVLEPGSGSGNFIGFAPDNAEMVGVELDSTTAAISKYLYPDAKIRNESFADTRLPGGSFDAVIGNVPFGDFKLTDRQHNRDGHSIHNHFIIKSLELTRPGGIVAVLSSRYTMDSQSPKARKRMAELGDLVGAVRLPTGSHQRASGTSVIEDVLIFRRREPGAPRLDVGPDGGTPAWVNAEKRTIDGFEISVNDYWGVADGEGGMRARNTLGALRGEAGQHGSGSLVVDSRDTTGVRGDLAGLPAVLDRIVADADDAGMTMTDRPAGADLPDLIEPDASRHEGHIGLLSGERKADMVFTQAVNGASVTLKVPETQREELAALLGLRDTLSTLLREEAGSAADTPRMGELRAELNRRYDAYSARFGPINRFKLKVNGQRNPPGQGGFRRDPMSAIVRALEVYDPTTGEATKTDIFRKRAAAPRQIRETADTPADALALSMDTYGEINMPAIATMLGTDEADARGQLTGLVYEIPALSVEQVDAAVALERVRVLGEGDADLVAEADLANVAAGEGEIETAAAYLSGNVRRKLAAARMMAAADPRFAANVAALEAVVPRELGPDEIDGRLGAAWIDAGLVQQFLRELSGDRYAQVTQVGGFWTVSGADYTSASVEEWGTDRKDLGEIVQALLEQRSIKVNKKDPVTDKYVQDVDATIAAQEKAELVAERFAEWLWEDADRARRLQYRYNEQFNGIALRSYDDAPTRTYPGMAAGWKPYAHQNAAVERIVNEPTVLLGHVVGAGKTAEMTMGAAELKRLGLARKPAIVIPNHMLEQFSREYLEVYPNAKILAAGTKDLTGDKRREFVARAATGDWDAVILTQSAFESIPMSRDAQQAYINRELADMRAQFAAADAEVASGDTRSDKAKTVKKMEKAILRAEEALKKKLNKVKDVGITFEETGIDYLMVDEAHQYSNLRTLSNIQGAGTTGSDRATDLHMKLEHLRANSSSGRVATFATGTPIRNTVTQAYVMQRFLRPDLMREAGITNFDQWAGTFGQVVEEMELKPEGKGFRQTSRFARFRNVPELLRMFHTFADIKLAEDLDLPTPDLVGGKVDTVTVPASDDLRAFISDLGDRAEQVRNGAVKPEVDNMLKISGDGRKAALSMRLVGGEDEPDGGKIAAAADRIASIHQANESKVYPKDPKDPDAGDDPTLGALQIVFMDMGTPPSGKKKTKAKAGEDEDDDESSEQPVDEDAAGDIDVNTSGWNGYDALRDQLVERGIPREKIRYIHEAKNDLEKAEMFAAARAGRISVLIGSSEKMGVGTNVQKRAVALHHLDAPWRPADVEQRDGRIMRQGNLNPDVEIVRYVTEGSFDAYMWQTLQRKATFINQIMRGSLDVREIEDVGDTAMSYAEVKALATGNPDLLTKAKTDTLLGKLERLNRTHNRVQTNLRRDVELFATYATNADNDAAAYEAAIPTRVDTRGDKFSMSSEGRTLVKREKAAAAIGASIDNFMQMERGAYRPGPDRVLGVIGGHTLKAKYLGSEVRLYFDGIPGDLGTFNRGDATRPSGANGILRRAENHLANMESRAAGLRDRAEFLRGEVAAKRGRIGQDFPRESELLALRRKSARLAEKMRLDSEREKYDTPGQPGTWRTNPELPAELAFTTRIDTDAMDSPLLSDQEESTPPEAPMSLRGAVDAPTMRRARDDAGAALRGGDQAELANALIRMGVPEGDDPTGLAGRLLLLPTEVQNRRLDQLADVNLAEGQEGLYGELEPGSVPATDLDDADLDDERDTATGARLAEVEAEVATRIAGDPDTATITSDELAAARPEPEPAASISAERRAELEQFARDYAGLYGGPNAAGGPGADNAARYIAEGHADANRAEWTYLADYIRANPDLLNGVPPTQVELAERARAERARREQGAADATRLANEAQAAFQAGEFDAADALIDEAEAAAPERPWSTLRDIIAQGRRDAVVADGEEIDPAEMARAQAMADDIEAAEPDAAAGPVVDRPESDEALRERVASGAPGAYAARQELERRAAETPEQIRDSLREDPAAGPARVERAFTPTPLRPEPGKFNYSLIQRQGGSEQRDDNLRRLTDAELESVRLNAGRRGTVGESVRVEKIRRGGSPESAREKADRLEESRNGFPPRAPELREARQLRERADDYERRDAAGIGRHDFDALPFGESTEPADTPSSTAVQPPAGSVPNVDELSKMNAADRETVLRGLSDADWAAVRTEFRERSAYVYRQRQLRFRPERTRLERLERSIGTEYRRRDDIATGYTPPEFTDRNVLDAVGGESMDTAEMAETFKVPAATMLRALRRLEDGGFLTRYSGDDEGDDVSGGRNKIASLRWESADGRDADPAAVLARYDAANPAGSVEETANGVILRPINLPLGGPGGPEGNINREAMLAQQARNRAAAAERQLPRGGNRVPEGAGGDPLLETTPTPALRNMRTDAARRAPQMRRLGNDALADELEANAERYGVEIARREDADPAGDAPPAFLAGLGADVLGTLADTMAAEGGADNDRTAAGLRGLAAGTPAAGPSSTDLTDLGDGRWQSADGRFEIEPGRAPGTMLVNDTRMPRPSGGTERYGSIVTGDVDAVRTLIAARLAGTDPDAVAFRNGMQMQAAGGVTPWQRMMIRRQVGRGRSAREQVTLAVAVDDQGRYRTSVMQDSDVVEPELIDAYLERVKALPPGTFDSDERRRVLAEVRAANTPAEPEPEPAGGIIPIPDEPARPAQGEVARRTLGPAFIRVDTLLDGVNPQDSGYDTGQRRIDMGRAINVSERDMAGEARELESLADQLDAADAPLGMWYESWPRQLREAAERIREQTGTQRGADGSDPLARPAPTPARPIDEVMAEQAAKLDVTVARTANPEIAEAGRAMAAAYRGQDPAEIAAGTPADRRAAIADNIANLIDRPNSKLDGSSPVKVEARARLDALQAALRESAAEPEGAAFDLTAWRALGVEDQQTAVAGMDPDTRRGALAQMGADEVEFLMEYGFLSDDMTYRDQTIDRLVEIDPERGRGPRAAAADMDRQVAGLADTPVADMIAEREATPRSGRGMARRVALAFEIRRRLREQPEQSADLIGDVPEPEPEARPVGTGGAMSARPDGAAPESNADLSYREHPDAQPVRLSEVQRNEASIEFEDALVGVEAEDEMLGAYLSPDGGTLLVHNRAATLATIDNALDGLAGNLEQAGRGDDMAATWRRRQRGWQQLRAKVDALAEAEPVDAAEPPAEPAPDAPAAPAPSEPLFPDAPDAPEPAADPAAEPEPATDAPAGAPFEEFESDVMDLTPGQRIDLGGGDQGTVSTAPEVDDLSGRVYLETEEGERLEYSEGDRVLVVGGPAGEPAPGADAASTEEVAPDAAGQPPAGEGEVDGEVAPDTVPDDAAALAPDAAVLAREEMEAAQEVEADALGLVEAEDGAFEVEADVADRQDRVEALLSSAGSGGLNLAERDVPSLGADRRDLVEELRLQEAIRRRDLQRRRDARARTQDEQRATVPAESVAGTVAERVDAPEGGETGGAPTAEATPAAPKAPKPRPGLSGSVEDLADAIEAGDQAAVLRAAVRARVSLNRSRGDSVHHAALREALDNLADSRRVDPAELRTLAAALREHARERRNAQARGRRLAKRLERERLRGLIGQYDAELRGRGRTPEEFGGTLPPPGPTDAEIAAAGPPDDTDPDPGGGDGGGGGPAPDFPTPPPADGPAFDRGDPDGPTGQARVTAMVDRLGASPWRLVASDEQMLADTSGAAREMRVNAARAAFGPVLERFGPVVGRRTNETMDTSGQLATRLLGRRGRDAGMLDRDGATFAMMVPAAQKPAYLAAMREASTAYTADLVAQRRAGAVNERPEVAPSAPAAPAVAPIGSAQPGRVGVGGRVRALAPRPMADAAVGVPRFDSVDGVVAHLRTVEQPNTSGPGRTNSVFVRDSVIKNITSGAGSILSPGGGLLAYRDEEYSPKPWRILHTGSGVDVARIGGEVPIGAVLRSAPMLPDGSLYLDPAGMRRMIDAMERMTDARGQQIDWTQDVNAVDTDVRSWVDYRPDGSFDPSAGGASVVRDAAALEAMREDPSRYALTESFDAVRFRYLRGGTSQSLNPDRVDGSALSTSLRDGFRSLDRSLNKGRRGNGDYRQTAQLRTDQGHARLVAEAELRASSGEPEAAAALLEQVGQAMAGESRRDGAGGAVAAILDTLGELFSPVATEPDRLRGARPGDRVVLRGDGPDAPPRVLVVESAPVTALRRPDGTVVSRFALLDEVSGRRLSAESDTQDDSYAARIEPGRGGRAEAFLTQEAADVWAFVPAGQELPATGEDLRDLSRRAVEAFRAQRAGRESESEPSPAGQR